MARVDESAETRQHSAEVKEKSRPTTAPRIVPCKYYEAPKNSAVCDPSVSD